MTLPKETHSICERRNQKPFARGTARGGEEIEGEKAAADRKQGRLIQIG